MSLAQSGSRLELPASLQQQLLRFRSRLWMVKLAEATAGALCGVLLAFLALYWLDRQLETPASARYAIFAVAIAACTVLPVAFHRWIWSRRSLEQLARLLSKKFPSLGDQLLGVIEIVRSDGAQQGSRRLCEAAIAQVVDGAGKKDFLEAIPKPRHRLWAMLAAGPALAVLVLLVQSPEAASNAWLRLLVPWSAIDRFTYARAERLPTELIVPHGEPAPLAVALLPTTRTQPGEATLSIGQQTPLKASRKDASYPFELPPQIEPGPLHLKVGDEYQHVRVIPTLRPELTDVTIEARLPKYLERTAPVKKDARSGSVTLVNGSVAQVRAAASRPLAAAWVDGNTSPLAQGQFGVDGLAIEGARQLTLTWKDDLGLAGLTPFKLSIQGKADEAPAVSSDDLPRSKILLDSETLTFKVNGRDDFGVRVLGYEWRGIDPQTGTPSEDHGERILSAGNPEQELLSVTGTFSAKTLGLPAQPVTLRLFVEDYLPGRERVYGPPCLWYILTPEQHSIWLTEQLSKWHRQSLEVRDKEMALHQTNLQLRELSAADLDRPETRRQLEHQAAAEKSNGRRLSALTGAGEDLVRQAMKNPEFGVGHIEKWAEMLQVLKDISDNRMPSVADLLKQSAQAGMHTPEAPKPKARTVGQVRTDGGGKPSKPAEPNQQPRPAVPSIADGESSQQPTSKEDDPKTPEEAPGKAKPGRLTLPVTTLMGPPKKGGQSPAGDKLEDAIAKQKDLLAEFDKIAEELNQILANLEGSTLVKRLKAASRLQYKLAGQVIDQLSATFGGRSQPASNDVIQQVAQQEAAHSKEVSYIMDDLQAYLERRRMQQFKNVLDEMKLLDPVGSLRQLGDDIPKENGMSVAQAEYWSDTFDRWAEDLVDPACCGKCPGCKSKASLPPSIILEAMHILEEEINLREETRVAQQAKPALQKQAYQKQAWALAETQDVLRQRIDALKQKISELEDAEQEFGKEMQLLEAVARVMDEAAVILASPETGSPAIAAETEAIELLLQSKRINPKGGGGGGGANPGGGGGGTTNDAALALLGRGVNNSEVREDRGNQQTTGNAGAVLPEEFRSGLDEYFNQLDRGTP